MSLIVICGQPCSGKSSVAAALLALLEAKGVQASIVDEPSFGLTKTESYEGMGMVLLHVPLVLQLLP